jgi:hypothetical protein
MEQNFEVIEDRDGVGKGLPERSRSRQELGRYDHVMSQSVMVFFLFSHRRQERDMFGFVIKLAAAIATLQYVDTLLKLDAS